MSNQTWRSHVGFAREATYGSTGTGSVVYIPILSYDEWEDDRERIVDSAPRAQPSKDYFVYAGVNGGRTGYTWYAYLDTMNRFFKDIFGAAATVTQSSAGAHAVHNFGTTDTPLSETIYDFYGVAGAERRWHGMQAERLELKFDANSGAMTMKTVYRGYASSTGITETTVAYTCSVPKRGWEGALTLAGSTNNRLLAATFTFAREVGLIYSASNSQNPVNREVGPLEITGQLSFYGGTSSGGSTDTEYTLFRNNTSTTLSLTFFEASSSNALLIALSNANFAPATLDRGGQYHRWDVGVRGLYNTSDSGPGYVATTIASTVLST